MRVSSRGLSGGFRDVIMKDGEYTLPFPAPLDDP